MEIALSLSGGGLRAAVYHIGVLSYLDSIKIDDGSSLLDHVNILSSVSGGSLTALWYVLKKAEGLSANVSLCNLFERIVHSDIERQLYEGFRDGAKQGHTLIMQLALVYDELFFYEKKYGTILSAIQREDFNIHHFAVCATDFNNGRPFHFYASRNINVNGTSTGELKIGNSDSSIDYVIANELFIADIMAASSCFPGVFEPITFPNDFRFENPKVVEAFSKMAFSLMDGGIVDNQGVEAIVKLDSFYRKCSDNIDFIMVSDVAKASPKKFERSKNNCFAPEDKFVSSILQMAPWFINNHKLITYGCLFLMLIAIVGVCRFDGLLKYISCGLIGACAVIDMIYFCARRRLPKYYNQVMDFIKDKYGSALTFDFDESFIKDIKMNSIIDFGLNRINSLMLMANDVMMGQIRKYKLRQAFGEKAQIKTIVNAIYALTSNGTWKSKKKSEISQKLRPNDLLKINADEVANVGTRLCFSREQITNHIPEKLVACGQYTTCWNLLMWINRNKNQVKDLNETQKQLFLLEQQLYKDWEQFKQNPFFKSIELCDGNKSKN